ncbi:hypothetical protein CRM22_007840 [Opisthorchis felineus]|uniref:LisH domain-containing protein ARMC9 n=1 Tax=Opisthorchis felineus TaxID=147828 RepID=A0A4S2LDX9_OPIFE|nr:hypothetical protein CRM22_007840 [Opisthorchis felineus]
MNSERSSSDNGILTAVEQFLEYYQFRNTLIQFKEESLPFLNEDVTEWRPLGHFMRKNSILNLLKTGQVSAFFDSLLSLLPEDLTSRKDYQRLEFELQLFLATATWEHKNSEERNAALSRFRQYLETKGALLSQTTDLLPYYALPYVPNPSEHPIYQGLFRNPWRASVQLKLTSLLDNVLLEGNISQPRLVRVLTEHTTKRDRTLRQLHSELADAEKRASQAHRRFTRLQVDYQTLISVTADLLDALENSLKGNKLEDGVMQRIYTRLMNNQPVGGKVSQAGTDGESVSFGSAKDFSRFSGRYENFGNSISLDQSQVWNGKNEAPLFELDYMKIKKDIGQLEDRKKCYLLQALRWRLTKSSVPQREFCLTSFVRHDLLDLTTVGPVGDATPDKAPLLCCLSSQHHRVREYMARFVNALSSLCRGRAYLSQNAAVVKVLINEVLKEKDESITRENLVGALQKMSLRRPMQTVMIHSSIIPWVVTLLENTDSLSDYTLEYAVALCMNLCLRTSGKRNCLLISSRILKVLVELLKSDNIDIVPYVNGALYSILQLPEIRRVAVGMDLQRTLEGLIRADQAEMNRQFEFIIRRLRSHETCSTEESDDEIDDDDDEEDATALESDLDRQDMPPPDPTDLKALTGADAVLRDPRVWVGEGLLKYKYAVQPVVRGEANGGVDWCKPMLSRDSEARMSTTSMRSLGVLNRPTTPGQRSFRGSISESRPTSAIKAGRPVERPSPVSEESMHPLYLRDSLASLGQSFTEDTTPRASIQLDSGPHKEVSVVESQQTDSVKPKPEKSSSKTDRRRSAFESRPKIPRTPDTVSPTRDDKFNFEPPHSPDSTVTSSVTKLNPSKDVIRSGDNSTVNSRPQSNTSKRSEDNEVVRCPTSGILQPKPLQQTRCSEVIHHLALGAPIIDTVESTC